ncbi:MAG: M48 family metallopeptidase [Verrucomicrobiales bacterium]|nr:M48 family metallopeptidase [Verrucomicrobiales bacterium]
MRFVPKPLIETADASRGRRDLRVRVKDCVSVILVLGLVWLLLGWVAGGLAARIPDAWEVRVFGGAGAVTSGSSETDPAIAAAQQLLDRLTEGEELRALNYRVWVIDLPQPNAVAFPGGGIGVSRQLLEEVQSEEGLAFVLAHELGHHQHRDLLRGMGRRLILQLGMALMFDSGSAGSLNPLVEMGERAYSRQQERAADDFGLSLAMRKIGSSTNLLEFLHLAEQEERGRFGVQWAETHPATRERIRRLEGRLRGERERPAGDGD